MLAIAQVGINALIAKRHEARGPAARAMASIAPTRSSSSKNIEEKPT
jgi:hypothetical protein